MMFTGAAGDAEQCSPLRPCDEESIEGRAEAGALSAMAGGAVFVTGLLFVLVGVVLAIVGARRSQRAMPDAMRRDPRAPMP